MEASTGAAPTTSTSPTRLDAAPTASTSQTRLNVAADSISKYTAAAVQLANSELIRATQGRSPTLTDYMASDGQVTTQPARSLPPSSPPPASPQVAQAVVSAAAAAPSPKVFIVFFCVSLTLRCSRARTDLHCIFRTPPSRFASRTSRSTSV